MPRTSLTHLRLAAFLVALSCVHPTLGRAGGCGGEHFVPLAMVEPSEGFRTGCANAIAADWTDPAVAMLIDFPRCHEGPCARNGHVGLDCLFEHGYGCPIQIGAWVHPRPGRHAGVVERGLQARFDSDSDAREGICHAAYTGSERRILYVPKVAAGRPGASFEPQVLGFVAFFIRDRPESGRPLVLEFLYDVVPGRGGCPE